VIARQVSETWGILQSSLIFFGTVLGTKDSSGAWMSTLLSSNHNGHNNDEVIRIRQEHPEDERDTCVLNDRVFGVLAVTRGGQSTLTVDVQFIYTFSFLFVAIGDYYFKLPASYTERIFLKASPGFSRPDAVREFISRNLTPPYISNQADVRHVDLTLLEEQERVLIMCSDGFVDLYMYDETRAASLEHIAAGWISLLNLWSDEHNEALRLLRDAIGGEDEDKVARNLTRRAPVRWIDDTTVLVVRL
jgi:pyruvate dehydrogenase phosphatase